MTTHIKKGLIWMVAFPLSLLLLVAVVGPQTPYKRVANSVCPVCGSTRREITWFGLFSHEEYTVSALEKWLKRKEPTFQPEWQFISEQTFYVLGRSCGVSGSPEIYQLVPILDDVVEKLSDERIAGLVLVLRQGSPDAQRQEIQRISDDYFDVK